MKKRNPPCTPYREKAKGKENRRDVIHGTRLSGAHRRVTRVSRAIDATLDIAVLAFSGTPDDRHIWAAIAWRIGAERFENAIREKIAENMADGEPRDRVATFQAYLDKHFPKPARKGGAE